MGTISVIKENGLGLTLLIPHMLRTNRSYLEGAKLRVFTLATNSNQLAAEQRCMAEMLTKFRINYSDVIIIPDINQPPSKST